MDRSAVLCLWETLARGTKEYAEIRQDQIDVAEARNSLPWLDKDNPLRTRLLPRLELSIPRERERSLSFLESAGELAVRIPFDNGIEILETGFLFQALNRSRNGFDDKPITSDQCIEEESAEAFIEGGFV